MMKNISSVHVEVVHLGEKKYVGIAVTSTLKNVKGIGEARQTFRLIGGGFRD